MTRDTRIRLVVTIEPLKAGDWVIEASVEAHSATAWFTASDKLNVTVSEDQTAQYSVFEIIIRGAAILLAILTLHYWRPALRNSRTATASSGHNRYCGIRPGVRCILPLALTKSAFHYALQADYIQLTSIATL